MCGIAGEYRYREPEPVDLAALERVRDAMAPRGPDHAGLWARPDLGTALAHRRLSIIDPSPAADQPMTDKAGSAVVFNGELYNYRELRRELESLGRAFATSSDTEVLLQAYLQWGRDCLPRLRGMFAFALFDSRDGSLFLARDPFGMKPLYVADDGRRLRFASQVKALRLWDGLDLRPDPAGHVGFHLWGHVPEPFTLHKGISALPAGCWLHARPGAGVARGRYFSVREALLEGAGGAAPAPSERVALLREALEDSVRHHLVADVPVGVFLSSGVDSTVLASLAAARTEDRLRTFTLGFPQFKGSRNDETPWAARVARGLGARHHEGWVRAEDFRDELPRILAAMDQPSVDGVNTYFVSRLAGQGGVKVALSGLGGDELFGSYSTFRRVPRLVRAFAAAGRLKAVSRGLRSLASPLLGRGPARKYAGLLEYGGSYPGAYFLCRGLFMPWELGELFEDRTVRQGLEELGTFLRLEETIAGVRDERARVAALELEWYMRNQLLRDSDWAGMAHSLEVRLPFADVGLLRRLAPWLAAGQGPTKAELAAAVGTVPLRTVPGAHEAPGTALKPLPAGLARRPKTGFSVPMHSWHRTLFPWAGAFTPRAWARRVYSPERTDGKVLALLTDAYAGRFGIAQSNRDLLSALCADPRFSTVQALPRLAPEPAQPLPAKLDYVRWAHGSKTKYMAAAAALAAADRRPDLILCGHIHLLPAAAAAKRICGAPLALMIYGIDAWTPPGRLARHCLADVDAVISISKVTLDKFRSWAGGRAAGFLLPLCVEAGRFGAGEKDPRLVARYGLEGKAVLMTMGRMEPGEHKGFDVVLDALPGLLRRRPDAVYLACGSGSDEERLRRRARELRVEGSVRFAGFVPEEEKAAHYSVADAFVLPSRCEGFGIVLLEALASGVPTVASRLDGGAEALLGGELGELVDPGSPEEVREAVLRALGRPKRVPPGLSYFSRKSFEARVRGIVGRVLLRHGEASA